jgi:hypothetical protein
MEFPPTRHWYTLYFVLQKSVKFFFIWNKIQKKNTIVYVKLQEKKIAL